MDMDSPQKKLGSMDGNGKTPPLLLVQLAKKAMADAHCLASVWAFVTAWILPFSYAFAATVPALCQLPWCDSLGREVDGTDSALWIGLCCCAALQAAAAALAHLLPCRRRRIRRALAFLTVVGRCMMASLFHHATYPGLGYLLLIVLIVNAAAAVALLLPCFPRRIRRALAYLAVAILCCCIVASLVPLAVETGLLVFLIAYTAAIFTLAVGDLLSFLALLLGGEDWGVAADRPAASSLSMDQLTRYSRT